MSENMWRAARLVRERLERTVAALEAIGVPYALSGSNATALQIESVDDSAVRQARNVEVLLQRSDLHQAESALREAGFISDIADARAYFHDGDVGNRRFATEITFAGEPVAGKSPAYSAPPVTMTETVCEFRVIQLCTLVKFQLARYRLDDAVDLRDMMDVGLIDFTWLDRFPTDLSARLKILLDDPDG